MCLGHFILRNIYRKNHIWRKNKSYKIDFISISTNDQLIINGQRLFGDFKGLNLKHNDLKIRIGFRFYIFQIRIFAVILFDIYYNFKNVLININCNSEHIYTHICIQKNKTRQIIYGSLSIIKS